MRRLLVVTVLCLVGLPVASAAAVGRQSHDSLDGPSIPVHVSVQGKVMAPARVHPRYEEIANRSDQELVVVGEQHVGAKRLVADLRSGAPPILSGRLARDFVVVDTVVPHADVFTVLPAGSYLIATRSTKATAADVATVRVAGSRSDQPTPAAASEIVFTKANHLAVPNPTYAESALYIVDHGTRTAQIRLYRLAKNATTSQIAAFTAKPTWARLNRLPITTSADLATVAAGRWVTNGDLPAPGRYVAIAAILRPNTEHRSRLTPALVAAVSVKS